MRPALEEVFAKSGSLDCVGRLLPSVPGSGLSPTWLSYSQVGARVFQLSRLLDALAGPLESLGATDKRRPICALYGPNSVEWICADLACSGSWIPSVGVQPWPAEKLKRVLTLTQAETVVCTTIGSLEDIVAALDPALNPSHSVKNIVLLDPAATQPPALKPCCGARLWCPPRIPPAASEEAGTVSVGALEALADSAGAKRAWASTAAAGAQESSGGGSSPPHQGGALFPKPPTAWLESQLRLEKDADASTGLGDLYWPLCTSKAISGARSKFREEGWGAAAWPLVAEKGGEEGLEWELDMRATWSLLFATGSSGKLKGVCTSRADWASGNGAHGGPAAELCKSANGNKTTVLVDALSHGLPRGYVWKAILVGGRVGCAVGGGGMRARWRP